MECDSKETDPDKSRTHGGALPLPEISGSQSGSDPADAFIKRGGGEEVLLSCAHGQKENEREKKKRTEEGIQSEQSAAGEFEFCLLKSK